MPEIDERDKVDAKENTGSEPLNDNKTEKGSSSEGFDYSGLAFDKWVYTRKYHPGLNYVPEIASEEYRHAHEMEEQKRLSRPSAGTIALICAAVAAAIILFAVAFIGITGGGMLSILSMKDDSTSAVSEISSAEISDESSDIISLDSNPI